MEADLAIGKIVNATIVNYLDSIKFNLNVINLGSDAAKNVTVIDVLLSGLGYGG